MNEPKPSTVVRSIAIAEVESLRERIAEHKAHMPNILKPSSLSASRAALADMQDTLREWEYIAQAGPAQHEEAIVEDALNAAVAHIQRALGQTDGGNAGLYFMGGCTGGSDWETMIGALERYLRHERACMLRQG